MMYGYCMEEIDVGHLTLKQTPIEQWLASHNRGVCWTYTGLFVLRKRWEEWFETYTIIN